jgi:hypothetical protein
VGSEQSQAREVLAAVVALVTSLLMVVFELKVNAGRAEGTEWISESPPSSEATMADCQRPLGALAELVRESWSRLTPKRLGPFASGCTGCRQHSVPDRLCAPDAVADEGPRGSVTRSVDAGHSALTTAPEGCVVPD